MKYLIQFAVLLIAGLSVTYAAASAIEQRNQRSVDQSYLKSID